MTHGHTQAVAVAVAMPPCFSLTIRSSFSICSVLCGLAKTCRLAQSGCRSLYMGMSVRLYVVHKPAQMRNLANLSRIQSLIIFQISANFFNLPILSIRQFLLAHFLQSLSFVHRFPNKFALTYIFCGTLFH